MAKITGKLTKIGRNDFGGIVIQLDGASGAEITVYDDNAAFAAPFLMALVLMSMVEIPVVGYKGKIQIDMATIGQPASVKGNKWLNSLKKFYMKKKSADDELAPQQQAVPGEEERG